MSSTTDIKRGDLLPPLVIDLYSGTDADTGEPVPVDLTTAQSIKVIGWRSNVLLFSRTVTLPTGDDALNGVVTMPWVVTDTDTWADLYIEVEVTWPGSKRQTFPADGYFVVRVTPDLG